MCKKEEIIQSRTLHRAYGSVIGDEVYYYQVLVMRCIYICNG